MRHDWNQGPLYPEATMCKRCGCIKVPDTRGKSWYVMRDIHYHSRIKPLCWRKKRK